MNARALYNKGCSSFYLINSRFTTKNRLSYISITPREVTTYEGLASTKITKVAYFYSNIRGVRERIYTYIVLKLVNYNLILGKRWKHYVRAYIDLDIDRLVIKSKGISILNLEK